MVSGLGTVWVDGQIISTNKGDKVLWIESKDIELNTRDHKYIDTFNAELKNSGSTTAKIKIGYRDRLEDELQWTEQFPLSDLDNLCWTRITARFFRVRIDDEGPETIWKLSALEFFGNKMKGRL